MKPSLREIPGYPGYAAAASGDVWTLSDRHGAERKLSRHLMHGRYWRVPVIVDGKRKMPCIHRLIALAFLGIPANPKHQVRHLNCDCLDNRRENLAYGLAKDNARDGILNGRQARGERNGSAKLTQEQVKNLRAEYSAGTVQIALAARYGISQSQVSDIVRDKSWS